MSEKAAGHGERHSMIKKARPGWSCFGPSAKVKSKLKVERRSLPSRETIRW
jgi:hypothetical protein